MQNDFPDESLAAVPQVSNVCCRCDLIYNDVRHKTHISFHCFSKPLNNDAIASVYWLTYWFVIDCISSLHRSIWYLKGWPLLIILSNMSILLISSLLSWCVQIGGPHNKIRNLSVFFPSIIYIAWPALRTSLYVGLLIFQGLDIDFYYNMWSPQFISGHVISPWRVVPYRSSAVPTSTRWRPNFRSYLAVLQRTSLLYRTFQMMNLV